MEARTWIRMIVQNLLEKNRLWTKYLPNTELVECPDVTYTISELSFPSLNVVYNASFHPAHTRDRVREVLQFYRLRNRSPMWVTLPTDTPNVIEALQAEGLVCQAWSPGMAIDLTEMAERTPDELKVSQVGSSAELRIYTDILIRGYPIPVEVAESYYLAFDQMGYAADASTIHYLGWWHGTPVATVTAFFGETSVGLYHVTTLPDYRKRGIAVALTREILVDAQKRGYKVATLTSTTAGLGVYRRVGFVEYCKVGLWFSSNGS